MDQLGSHDMNTEIKCRVTFPWERKLPNAAWAGESFFLQTVCVACTSALQAVMMEKTFSCGQRPLGVGDLVPDDQP